MDTVNNSNSNSASGSSSTMQDSVIGTLVKFESAIAGLTQTVEQTRHNIEHVVDLSMKSKDELKAIKDSLMPYFSSARQASQKVVTKVRENPMPLAWTLATLVGGLFIFSFFQSRSFSNRQAALH